MAIELAVVSTTGSTSAINLGTLITANPAKLTLKLLTDSDPAMAPVDVATIHLSSDVETAPGFFLTPDAPVLEIACNPGELWVSVHGDDEFVQVIAN